MEVNATLNGREVHLRYPAVMGILNLTPDSFSDGGRYLDLDRALQRCETMIAEGAQIIDIGAESTRPGADPIDEDEELARLLPVLKSFPFERCILSVDTSKTTVQREVLRLGAHIINDVSGGDDALFSLASKHQAGLVLMHRSGTPKVMQTNTTYQDVVKDVFDYLRPRIEHAKTTGVPLCWGDPGIGFGKTLEQNLALLRATERFTQLGDGALIGASRKSWINQLCHAEPHLRLGGSLAAALQCARMGAAILRVHDVSETVQALKVLDALAQPTES